jgi:hypothetical protein
MLMTVMVIIFASKVWTRTLVVLSYFLNESNCGREEKEYKSNFSHLRILCVCVCFLYVSAYSSQFLYKA